MCYPIRKSSDHKICHQHVPAGVYHLLRTVCQIIIVFSKMLQVMFSCWWTQMAWAINSCWRKNFLAVLSSRQTCFVRMIQNISILSFQAGLQMAEAAAEESFARYQKDQMRQVALEMHHRDCSLGSASSEPPADSPYQQSSPHPVDPLIQEKEEFKAALLATRFKNKARLWRMCYVLFCGGWEIPWSSHPPYAECLAHTHKGATPCIISCSKFNSQNGIKDGRS